MTEAGLKLRAEPEPPPLRLDSTVLRWLAIIVLAYATGRLLAVRFWQAANRHANETDPCPIGFRK